MQIDDYGPWTTTPAPRRETDLQALQARLFATVADFLGDRDGYAFASRYDNMIGVANAVEPEAFARLQKRVANRFPVTVESSEFLGDVTRVHGDWDGRRVLLRVDEAPRGTVDVGFDPVDAHVVSVDRD